jgi:hypothetical protein
VIIVTVTNPQGRACLAPSITGVGTSRDSTFPEPTNLNSRITPPDATEICLPDQLRENISYACTLGAQMCTYAR